MNYYNFVLQTEGEYEATLSAFNPLDGWYSSKTATVEVLEPIGPIAIDDGSQYTDKVNLQSKGNGPKTNLILPFTE